MLVKDFGHYGVNNTKSTTKPYKNVQQQKILGLGFKFGFQVICGYCAENGQEWPRQNE